MAGKTCVICGAPSGMYPLCIPHLQMKKEGKVVKCEKCSKWHLTDNRCDCKSYTTQNSSSSVVDDFFIDPSEFARDEDIKENKNKKNCIICGAPSGEYARCKDCYYEGREYYYNYDKNKTSFEFRDHYYNLKDKIFRMTDHEQIKSSCNNLYEIAYTCEETTNDKYLVGIVQEDIKYILEKKKEKQNAFSSDKENAVIKERNNRETIRTIDGHRVASDKEKEIDDYLYQIRILHSYGKLVDEVIEEPIYCDWFIPIINEKGIYIEYFGMDTPSYLKRRKRKEELYEKYRIPHIYIEKDQLTGDSQGFIARLKRELRTIAIERFNYTFDI